MKKILFLILTIYCSASAAWTVYAENDERIMSVELSSVRKDCDTRTFWLMNDYKQISPYGDLSARTKVVFDCKKEMKKILDFATFSQRNLGGAVTSTLTPVSKWEHIPPSTYDYLLIDVVCK